jgi:hypothetical protein
MSVVGISTGSGVAARAYQPVCQVDATTGEAAGSGATADGSTPIAGADGTGVATAANPTPTRNYGSAAIATSQVTVGTGSTQIVAARSGRVSVTVRNLGTLAFYVGVTGLTTGNGFLVPGVVGAEVTIPTQAAVFGIAAVAQAVSVLEVY